VRRVVEDVADGGAGQPRLPGDVGARDPVGHCDHSPSTAMLLTRVTFSCQ
jgi:hypothetical protein